ncbi:metal ABC transporter substrate-binding protein [Rhizomonospora bruguierae]|uniref:metal ABC transporter substrate-binding protein n=1 Tax=Rhizomonospora bruguierae TaxID=1581705 RepID=UPI001BCEC81E|nr:metal ABC transporter substrate-binding protein [Micromonospora sp. NBRC 107566]
MPNRSLRAAALALLTAAGLAGCTATASVTGDRVAVITAFYPLQFVTERVGGDAVSVDNLTKPGAEPHDLELSPKQVAQVTDADLAVYLKGFQPAVDDAVGQRDAGKNLDVASVQPLNAAPPGEEGGLDPHVWLDPVRLGAIADAVATRLGEVDPTHAADYTGRAAALRADLGKLDAEYAAGLANCERHEIVTSHAAFGYLAARYHLTQVALSGLTPEQEPSSQRLATVVEQARAHHATTIFFETLVSPKVAEVIAKEVGAKTAVLDPIEGLEPGDSGDYLSVMRSNLSTLRTALGCS